MPCSPFAAVFSSIFWSRCQSTMFALSLSINFHCLKAVWGGVKSLLNSSSMACHMPLILLSLLIFHGTICHLPWSFSPDDTSICMPHIYVALRFWLFCSSTFFDFNPATLSPRVVLFLSPFRTSAWSLQIFNLSLLTSLAGGYQHFLVAL